ncbi:MAG: tetratricopeptide repeat protein, partial [Chloroflexi bacterium]|nr:tetratricopeptide repeat protein [Chloroflexota bacterium]
LAIAREIGDTSGEANDSFNMALLYRQQGNTARALEFAQHALALYRQMENPNVQAADQLIAAIRSDRK